MRKFLVFLLMLFLLGCSKPQKGLDPSLSYFSVVLAPIGNSTVRGLIKFHKESPVTVDVFIGGLIPGKKYRLGVYEYGDLSSIDGKSIGELLYEKNEKPSDDKTHKIIGDLGILESDYQGLVNRHIKTNIDPSLFNDLLGRGLMISYEGQRGHLNLGYGVVGIGNNAYLFKK